MRIFKFVLLFLLILTLSTVVAGIVAFKKIPTLESDMTLLILGKGGEGHTAPNLTDTIMISHFNIEKNSISFISIPRDIWIAEIRAKLNTAYYYGGFDMAKDSVKTITGLNANNLIIVDFSLFKDFIDAIGGISVYVETPFTDERYPIAGKENDLCFGDPTYACRYETISFDKGVNNMNGETALKFVRSRNSILEEGSELARENRQQIVVSAIREKILKEVIFSPSTINNVYKVTIDHLETDLDLQTVLSMAKFVYQARDNITFQTLAEELLIVSQNDRRYDRQYVFLPKSGNWLEVQEWIKSRI